MKLESLQSWSKDGKFLSWLNVKGVDIKWADRYSFNRKPQETDIEADFKLLNKYRDSYIKTFKFNK